MSDFCNKIGPSATSLRELGMSAFGGAAVVPQTSAEVRDDPQLMLALAATRLGLTSFGLSEAGHSKRWYASRRSIQSRTSHETNSNRVASPLSRNSIFVAGRVGAIR